MSEELYNQISNSNLKKIIENTKTLFINIKSTKDILKNISLIVRVTLALIVEIEKTKLNIKRKLTGEEKHDLVMFVLSFLIELPFWSRWISQPVLSVTVSVIVQVLNIIFNHNWQDAFVTEPVNVSTEVINNSTESVNGTTENNTKQL